MFGIIMFRNTGFVYLFLLCLFSLLLSCQQATEQDYYKVNKSLGLDEKIKFITNEIKIDRLNPALFQKRAILHLENKNLNGALNDISVAIRIDSSIASQYFTLSDIYTAKKDFVLAIEEMKTGISLDPKNVDALLKIADMLYQLKDFKESIIYLKRLTAIDKFNTEAFFLHGMILKEVGDTAKAVTSFQTVVENNPEHYKAYLQLGLLYYSILDPIALDYLENAIELNPNSLIAKYTKAMYYQKTNNFEMAINTYYEIIDLDIYFTKAHYNLGHILYEDKGDYEISIEHFSNAIKCDSTYFRAYYMRGLCYEQLKIYNKAKADFLSTLNHKTNYELAISGLNRLDKLR